MGETVQGLAELPKFRLHVVYIHQQQESAFVSRRAAEGFPRVVLAFLVISSTWQ